MKLIPESRAQWRQLCVFMATGIIVNALASWLPQPFWNGIAASAAAVVGMLLGSLNAYSEGLDRGGKIVRDIYGPRSRR